MAQVFLVMTMSLDGFINDRNGSVDRLYPDLDALRKTEMLQELIKSTGAVVMGRHAYAMADPDSFADNYEFQVPIFVLAHSVPEKRPKENERLTFTFVTDGVNSALEKAKAAAGDKYVTVIGGAHTAQQCLQAGLVDEMQIGLVPVVFGEGIRFLEHLGTDPFELEQTQVIESNNVTYLRYRVVK